MSAPEEEMDGGGLHNSQPVSRETLGLPWAAEKAAGGFWLVEENDGASVPMFLCSAITGTPEEAEARMGFAAHAANCHDELVEALKNLLTIQMRQPRPIGSFGDKAFSSALTALARATGEQS